MREHCRRHDGVVVTHGTDTLEETAALLALTHDGVTPVVVTGAQRPFDDPAPDGPTNLAAALAWAARGRPGVTVVFDGRVLPAIGARKVHTSALTAFAAPGRGPLASVDGGVVREHATAPPTGLADPPERLPRVDVVAQYVGADAHAIDAAAAAGAEGVVIAAFGAGNATPPVVAAAEALIARGVPVAVASRTGEGAGGGALRRRGSGPRPGGGTVRRGPLPVAGASAAGRGDRRPPRRPGGRRPRLAGRGWAPRGRAVVRPGV